MPDIEALKAWIEAHETFLSGLAAFTFLATLLLAPLAATTRAIRRRRGNASPDDTSETDTAGVAPLTNEQILERPAVAVLPFSDPGVDGAPDYFASGITEDLITALASFRCFPVIGRSSVFSEQTAGRDVCELGRELSARYVVHGTVRREAEQVRINAKLTDTESGHTLWARSYDRAYSDVFALQDEITEAIVSAIEPRLERAEERRVLSAPEDALDAWDSSLRALWHVRQGTPDDLATARQLLEWAIVRDPLSSRAHSVLALCLFQEALLVFQDDPSKALAGTLRAARAAVDLDDDDWLAHALLGIATMWTLRDFERALAEQDRALELNPSAAISHQFRGCVLEFSGHVDEAIRSLDLVLRLEPRYQSRAMVLADLSLCHLLKDDTDQAVSFARRALDEDAGNLRAHQRLVAALGVAGDPAAAAAREELLERQPEFSLASLPSTYPFRHREHADIVSEGLRLAGVPATSSTQASQAS